MINQIGGFEDIVEKGQSTVRKVAKSTAKGGHNFAKTASGQVSPQKTPPDQGTNEAGTAAQNQQMSDDAAKQFLRDLYGKSDKSSDPQKSQNSSSVGAALGIPQKDPNAGKTPEEIAKLEALRKQLHGDYYQSLTNPKKPAEEHVTEKLEREGEEEKMSELEVQKKKPPALAATVKRGTGETVVGVSG